MDTGYRRFAGSGGLAREGALDQAYLSAELLFKPARDLGRTILLFRVRRAGGQQWHARLTELIVTADLRRSRWAAVGRSTITLLVTDCIGGPTMSFGAQDAQDLEHAAGVGTVLPGRLLGRAMPIAAVARTVLAPEGQDLGSGVGSAAAVSRSWPGAVWGLSPLGELPCHPIIRRFRDADLHVRRSARIFLEGRLGVGVEYARLWRWSNYYGRSLVERHASELRVYLSTALPRWGTS